MPPRKRNRWPQALVRLVAVLAFFSPFVCRAEYIKAVNYFGKSWPIAFWNSDLSEVSADFQDIQRDGFNSIILIVPWGEFQPGLDPIRFNDDAYHRLTSVCNQAHSAGLKVFLRVSYAWDYYPNVQQPGNDRAVSLISGASLIPAWDQYLAKINAATQSCSEGAFISWEDFWKFFRATEMLKTPEERAVHSKQIGYATWIDRHADNAYRERYAADLRKFGVYPVPSRDNPDYEMVFQYFDDQMMNQLLPVLAKNFRQASVEARIDSDPIYNGKELLKWLAHPQHYAVTSSDFLMTYWAPAMGAVNQGEKDSSEKVIDRFNALHRSLLAQIPKQLFIGQWQFRDNTPGFHYNAQVNPSEMSRFIRDSARPLAQFTAGYALWNWRDYRRSHLFNGFFSLGKLGWDFSPGASIQTFPDGAYAQLPQGQSIHQDIQRMHDDYEPETVRLQFTARGNGRVRVDIGSASQEVNIQAAPGARAVVTLQFPMPSAHEHNFDITALSGSIQLKDLYLWSFEQVSDVRSFDNSPSDHHDDIIVLNRKLDDPKTVLSSVSASNATINYLAGAERPESDGTRKFAWVGPYAKVRLYATAPTIVINGFIDIDMFREAKLFPAGCTLAASINGKQISQTLFTESQTFAMNINVPPEARGVVTLELKNNCSMNPKEMGIGADSRTLSYMIHNIQGESSAEEN